LCVTHSVEAVEAALDQARRQGGWSADTVRHLLRFESCQDTPAPPLDPSAYPAYQGIISSPDLLAYNRLLEVR